MGFTYKKFGTLYMGDEPVPIPRCPRNEGDVTRYRSGEKIKVGDTTLGMEISWIKSDKTSILVSDRVLLCNVSYTTLAESGFIGGKPITIDGKKYFCRLINAGSREPNEWTKLVNSDRKFQEDNLLHTKDMYFWCQNKEKGALGQERYEVRGLTSPTDANYYAPTYTAGYIGFRPVLVPDFTEETDYVSDTTILLDNQKFQIQFSAVNPDVKASFTPRLLPMMTEKSGKEIPDTLFFRGVSSQTPIKMFSLLMDEAPVYTQGEGITPYKPGARLVITDRYFGEAYLIPWVIKAGMAEAAKPLLNGISANDIKRQPFFGDKQIQLWEMGL